MPSHEIYMNLTTILAIFAFGFLTIRYVTRLMKAKAATGSYLTTSKMPYFFIPPKPPALLENLSK